MVSLQDENSAKRFMEPTTIEKDSEQLVKEEVMLNEVQVLNFRPIRIVPILIVEMVMVVILVILGFVIEPMCKNQCSIDPYNIMFLAHVAAWIIACIIDRYLHREHFKSRIRGHLAFYYTTRWIRRCTFYVFCFGNAFLIVFNIVLHYQCDEREETCFHIKVTPLNILQICILVESFFILPAHTLYIYHTILFNKSKPRPDIVQEDLTSPDLPSYTASSQLGFTTRDYVSEMIEKQADAIRALKNHNYVLARKIYDLQRLLEERSEDI